MTMDRALRGPHHSLMNLFTQRWAGEEKGMVRRQGMRAALPEED